MRMIIVLSGALLLFISKATANYPTRPNKVHVLAKASIKFRTHFSDFLYLKMPNLLVIDTSPSAIELQADGALINRIKDSVAATYSIIPIKPSLKIYFIDSLSGDTVAAKEFKVRLVPAHNIKLTIDGRMYQGYIPAFNHVKQMEVCVEWDQRFREAFPDEYFRFRVTKFDIFLLRDKRAIDQIQNSSQIVDIQELMNKAKSGDRLLVNLYMMKVEENGKLSYMNCGVLYTYTLGKEEKP